ncbi:protein of unknown function [Pararobbsia alpina]
MDKACERQSVIELELPDSRLPQAEIPACPWRRSPEGL